MVKSIKYNFLLNLINTLTGLLFPLVTFPYVARVLDPDGVGIINFYISIISYIMLISGLGIGIYSVRELARVRDDKPRLARYTAEILSLHLFMIVLAYVVVAILCLTVARIRIEYKIFLVLSTYILGGCIGAGWFFQATEDFKFITIRSVIVKFLSALALFLLVRNKDDLMIYAIILAFADGGSNICNFIRLQRKVGFRGIDYRAYNMFKHLKPSLRIFALNIIVSLYIQMAPFLLGFMTDNSAVGYFSAASRIQMALLSVVTALGTTLLPRMSYYYSNGNYDEFVKTECKGLTFIILLTLPIVVGVIMTADLFMPLFTGDEFGPSVLTLKIISLTIVFIGISGIVGMQVLYPQGYESIVIQATSIGAVVSLVVSLFLIPSLKQYGAAWGFASAEFAVTLSMIVIGRKRISYKFLNRDNVKALLSVLFMAICVYCSGLFFEEVGLVRLIIEIVIGFASYTLGLAVTGHSQFMWIWNGIKKSVVSLNK